MPTPSGLIHIPFTLFSAYVNYWSANYNVKPHEKAYHPELDTDRGFTHKFVLCLVLLGSMLITPP